MNTKLDFHLQGAPNFRVADLNVYGVAQPTVSIIIRPQSALLNLSNIDDRSIHCIGIAKLSPKE